MAEHTATKFCAHLDRFEEVPPSKIRDTIHSPLSCLSQSACHVLPAE